MPTYEYECDACGCRFDEFQSMTAPRLKKCPTCKKPKLRRLIGTGAGVIFKGSGFYETDYRSDGYKASAKADVPAGAAASASAAPTTTDGGTKTESSATAPPAKTATETSGKSNGTAKGSGGKKK